MNKQTREQHSARLAAIGRTLCRIPRLVKINTIAFRRATHMCGCDWEPRTAASKRQRSLRPRWKPNRGYLIRTMPRGPVNSHSATPINSATHAGETK